MAARLKERLLGAIDALSGIAPDALVAQRYQRLRRYGAFRTA